MQRMIPYLTLVLLFLGVNIGFCFSGVGKEGVNLAALKGWTIVVSPSALPSEVYAAKEFRKFVHQATGVSLEILTESDQTQRVIFIGPSEALQKSPIGFSTQKFGDEDLRIILSSKQIAIAGGKPRGTLYGVYTFLEDYLGVRFLTADHTHVPRLEGWRVVGPVDRFYQPPFEMRSGFYMEMNENPEFAARLRINNGRHTPSGDYLPLSSELGGESPWRIINHSAWKQIPFDKYGKTHPEYYAMIDGKRPSPDTTDLNLGICWSNLDVVKIVVDSVREEIRNTPEAKNVAVSMNDTHARCQCPECLKIYGKLGDGTDLMVSFVNGVAREVRKDHPEVLIGTLGYFHNRKPPEHIKPDPNVQIMLCSYEACRLHAINDPNCPANVSFCKDFKGWDKITPHIFIWCYITNWGKSQLPVSNFDSFEPTFRFYASQGVKGIFVQSMHHTLGTEFSDLKNYMTANLLWDPNRSGRQLMDEFMTLHYGSAAPPIREWINLMQNHIHTNKIHQGLNNDAISYGVDESIAEHGLRAFEEAMKLADNPTIRLRVEKLSICAYRAAIAPIADIDDKVSLDPKVVERMGPLVKTFFDLCEKHEVRYSGEGAKMDVLKDQVMKRLK